MRRLIPSDSPRDPSLYYGAACLPNVRGVVVECASREEYLADRELYEESEGNCNTCIHLIRPPRGTKTSSDGFLTGTCAKLKKPLKFHPEDPLHLECHEQRRRVPAKKDPT